MMFVVCISFFFKQKTAYEMRISDWSSDVCSSDLLWSRDPGQQPVDQPSPDRIQCARSLRQLDAGGVAGAAQTYRAQNLRVADRSCAAVHIDVRGRCDRR